MIGFIKRLFSKPSAPQRFYNFPSITNDSKKFRYEGLITKKTNVEDVHLDIATQARAICSSVGVVQGAIETLKSEILGEKGLQIDINTENQEVNEAVEKRFNLWCKNVGNNKSFYKFQHELIHKFYVDGEVFVYLRDDGDRLSLILLDTFRLTQFTEEKRSIYYGIQYDKLGDPKYYYFENKVITSAYPIDLTNTIKIHAKDIIHFKHGNYKRGISVLAPCIDMSYDALNLVKEELRRGIISSEFVGFMKTSVPPDCAPIGSNLFNGTFQESLDGKLQKNENSNEDPKGYGIEPGTLPVLPAGLEPVFTSPAEPPKVDEFLKFYFYHLGCALGLTYPTITGDLSEINYSSIRAGSLKERRLYGVRQTFLIEEVLNVVFDRWVNHPSNYGVSDFNLVREDILANFNFKTPTWLHVDPVKEANSIKIQLEQGMTTLTEYLKSKGKDLDEHLQELKNDYEYWEYLASRNTMLDNVADNEISVEDEEESQKRKDKRDAS